MMMKTKILIILLNCLFIFSVIHAQPQITQIKGGEIQRGTPQIQRGTQISDDPVIREFSANPTSFLQGGQVTFSWRVEPSPGGSPITGIRITVGSIELHRSTSAIGEQRVTLPPSLGPQLACQFVLTATNSEGKSAQKTINLEIVTDVPVIKEFSVEPNVVMAGREFRLIWRVEPRLGGSRVARVMLGPESVPSYGERTIRIDRNNFNERRRYTLVVTNERGQSVSQTREVEIKSIVSVKTSIHVFDMTMDPREIPEDIIGNFTITLLNESGITIEGVTITLVAKPEEMGRGTTRVVGVLHDQTIRPGSNEFRIRGVISSRGVTPKPRFLGIVLDLISPSQPGGRIEATTAIEFRTIESYHLHDRSGFRTIYY